MLNLMSMLQDLRGGAAVSQVEKQFGLDRNQAEAAIAALTPAFSEGLRRNASGPQGFGRFLEALSKGNHAAYADDPARAMTKSGRKEGNAILGHLFRSKGLSRAVAAEASQASGLSQGILKQILPTLAPIILGGLFKQIMGGGRGRGANPLGQILEQMMGGGARSMPRQSPRAGNNPIGDILEQMMGGGNARGRAAPNPMGGDNPLGKIFEKILGGQDKFQPPGRQRQRNSPQGGDLSDVFGEMFDSGRPANDPYTRQMESTFDEFLGSRRG